MVESDDCGATYNSAMTPATRRVYDCLGVANSIYNGWRMEDVWLDRWSRARHDASVEQKMSREIRLGVIVPSVNIVVEAWYPQIVPAGVSVHFARMLMPQGTSPERIIEMDRTDGVHAIHQLASCRPHAIAYGCTASSIVQGHAFDAHLREEIEHIAGCPATSATNSIFAACAALGMTRVTAVSPYPEAVDAAEHRFFAAGAIDTIAGAHLGISDGFRLAEPTPEVDPRFRARCLGP